MPPSFEIAGLSTWKRISRQPLDSSGILRFLTHCNALERPIDDLEESLGKFWRTTGLSPHERGQIKGKECGGSIVIRLSRRCGRWCDGGCDVRRSLRLGGNMGALFIQDLEAAGQAVRAVQGSHRKSTHATRRANLQR